jgi:hypothetical protein
VDTGAEDLFDAISFKRELNLLGPSLSHRIGPEERQARDY